MAKKDIHPDYHEISVILTNGTEFKTKSTYGKAGAVLKLDVDPINHPAWQADSAVYVNVNDNQISKFKKKFGNIDFGSKKETEKSEEKQEA